jgi:hypothetical protein
MQREDGVFICVHGNDINDILCDECDALIEEYIAGDEYQIYILANINKMQHRNKYRNNI